MSYVNAPATKLLATACACCGRDLVDAVSVETGIGPDCRAKYGVDVVVDAKAHEEANALVFQVAKKGVTGKDARAIFDRLHALGFVVLAERIAKRFRATVTPPVDVEAFRNEYRSIRAAFCYDNCDAKTFDALVKKAGPKTPADFVEEAKRVACPCRRCAGTGRYVVGTENGAGGGECFRCGGNGFQTLEDAVRNRYYDEHAAARALRAG